MNERPPVYVAVTPRGPGKQVKRELMIDGSKLLDLSKAQVVELIMQAASTLRYD